MLPRVVQALLMGQRQQMKMVPILEQDCDYGIDPHAERRLDLQLVGSCLHPVLHLKSATLEDAIVFEDGIDCNAFTSAGGSLRDFQNNASVTFCQEDPTAPDATIVIHYGQWRLEQASIASELKPFMDFRYLEAQGEEPDEDELGMNDPQQEARILSFVRRIPA